MASDGEREEAAVALAAMLRHYLTVARPESGAPPNRILLFDMRTQSLAVMSAGGEKEDGEPPASKAAIEKMPTVEIKCKEDIEKMCEATGTECVICMEDWGVGDVVKEMPCQHKFHGGCVEKWLEIHATCPVCRCNKMVEEEEEEDEDEEKSGGESENVGVIRGEIWVSFGGRTED